MPADKCFIDSNVYIYMAGRQDEKKGNIAETLVDRTLYDGSAVISQQVIGEFINVMLLKDLAESNEVMKTFVDLVMLPSCVVRLKVAHYFEGLRLKGRYQVSWWDSLIVAAALEAGCTTLYTEDLQHGQVIDGLTVCNPFMDG